MARSSGAPDRRGGCRHFGAVGGVAAVAALRGHALRGGRLPRGHTNTVDVTIDGVTHPVDTGFLVFNHQTYPNLSALFDEIDVESVETEMSFSVSLSSPGTGWAGSSLATVFGQKRNLRPPSGACCPRSCVSTGKASAGSKTMPMRRRRCAITWSATDTPGVRRLGTCCRWRRRSGPADGADARLIRCSPLFASAAAMASASVRPPLWRTVKGGGRVYVESWPRDC